MFYLFLALINGFRSFRGIIFRFFGSLRFSRRAEARVDLERIKIVFFCKSVDFDLLVR